MEKAIKHAALLFCMVLVVLLILFINNDIGILKANIEKNARASQQISTDWLVAKDTTT